MNGSEILTRQSNPVTPEFGYDQVPELTVSEKMDLVVFSSMPVSKAVYKLMELEIVQARNEAMRANPAKVEEQRALMTVAHAMDKFYTNVRGKITFATGEHIADVKLKVQQVDMEDKEKLEEIIFQNVTGIKS